MIRHKRWVTGKTLVEEGDAVIYYKDYGETIEITSWKGMPKIERCNVIGKCLFDSIVENIDQLLKLKQSGLIDKRPDDHEPMLKYVIIGGEE